MYVVWSETTFSKMTPILFYGDDSGQGALLTSKGKRNFSPEVWWRYSEKKKGLPRLYKQEVKKFEKQPITVPSVLIPTICSHDQMTKSNSLFFIR